MPTGPLRPDKRDLGFAKSELIQCVENDVTRTVHDKAMAIAVAVRCCEEGGGGGHRDLLSNAVVLGSVDE